MKGWVEGQPDGSFAPDRSISRAEAMTLVNRVLGRLPETWTGLQPVEDWTRYEQ